MAKKNDDKLFTPGNIILGIIVIALVGSLFFDFFGSNEKTDGPIGCPQEIKNLIATNILFTEDDVPIQYQKSALDVYNPNATYKISALLRNIGKEDIVLKSVLLTSGHLGSGDPVGIDEILIEGNSMKKIDIEIPRGDYHKIDLYGDACYSIGLWHDEADHPTEEETETMVEDELLVEPVVEENATEEAMV